MEQAAYISTREAAELLKVHARTIRKWIDTFEEYIAPELNEKGHYMLTEKSYSRLMEIKSRLQETQKPMREIKEDLIREGKMENPVSVEGLYPPHWNAETISEVTDSVSNLSRMMEELFNRMERMEDHLFSLSDCLYEIEHQFLAVKNQTVSPKEIHHMFDEIRKKQDYLKVQLRNVGYAYRLTSATTDEVYEPRRPKRSRLFGIF